MGNEVPRFANENLRGKFERKTNQQVANSIKSGSITMFEKGGLSKKIHDGLYRSLQKEGIKDDTGVLESLIKVTEPENIEELVKETQDGITSKCCASSYDSSCANYEGLYTCPLSKAREGAMAVENSSDLKPAGPFLKNPSLSSSSISSSLPRTVEESSVNVGKKRTQQEGEGEGEDVQQGEERQVLKALKTKGGRKTKNNKKNKRRQTKKKVKRRITKKQRMVKRLTNKNTNRFGS
jgi:hypothetical protein